MRELHFCIQNNLIPYHAIYNYISPRYTKFKKNSICVIYSSVVFLVFVRVLNNNIRLSLYIGKCNLSIESGPVEGQSNQSSCLEPCENGLPLRKNVNLKYLA